MFSSQTKMPIVARRHEAYERLNNSRETSNTSMAIRIKPRWSARKKRGIHQSQPRFEFE
jgi:hypothetical protein